MTSPPWYFCLVTLSGSRSPCGSPFTACDQCFVSLFGYSSAFLDGLWTWSAYATVASPVQTVFFPVRPVFSPARIVACLSMRSRSKWSCNEGSLPLSLRLCTGKKLLRTRLEICSSRGSAVPLVSGAARFGRETNKVLTLSPAVSTVSTSHFTIFLWELALRPFASFLKAQSKIFCELM